MPKGLSVDPLPTPSVVYRWVESSTGYAKVTPRCKVALASAQKDPIVRGALYTTGAAQVA